MVENDLRVDEKKEAFQIDFMNKMENVLKGGVVATLLAGGVALAHVTYSPYMNNISDIGGMLEGMGEVISGNNPIIEELLKHSMSINIIKNSINSVLKQKDYFRAKGQTTLYSLAGKIYDTNPEKFSQMAYKA